MELSMNSSTRGEPRTPPASPSSIAQPAITPPCGPKLSVSPMDNATPTHNSSIASLLSSEKGRSSPEPNCSICLGKLENKSFTNGCLHQFCFTCLLQWSKIKAECPLCKQSFKSIIHNVRSMQEYDEYHVTVPEPFPQLNYQIPYHDFLSTIQLQALHGRHPIAIPFRYSTTTMSTRRIDSRLYTRVENSWVLPPQRNSDRSSRPRWRHSRRIANAEFRSSVYTRDLWAIPPEDLMSRVRDCSPAFYRLNPAQVHRLVPWLNRELDVLLSGNTAPFVLDLIVRSVTQYEISSPEFRQLLRMHLGHRVDHFMHEFRSFASSHFDLVGYDQAVTYGPNPTPPATHSPIDLANEESSSSDSDVLIVPSDEPTAGPSGVNSGGRRQRPVIDAEPPPPNDADEDSDDCLIVQCVKPRHERTPEIIELSSEDEHVDVGVNQAAESLDEFPILTDFDLDSEELHEATLLLDDFQSTSLESNSNSSSSEYLPKYLGKRKATKKEVDVKKKESSKSSALKKTELKRAKSPCKKCAKRKSLLCLKKSSVCEKGKGKHSKCETCDKAATQSGAEERARRSRTNSSSVSKRPRRDAASDDSQERDATSLMKRLLENSRPKRTSSKRLPSSSSDEPVASTSSMPGPSRLQTKQRSGGNTQVSSGTTKPVWSSDDDEPIAKPSRQKRTKSHSSVDTSRKKHKKKARSSGDSELSTKTRKTAKERSGTHSRKRRAEASTNLSAVSSDSNEDLDVETVSAAAHYRVRESNEDNVVVSPNSSSELHSHSFSRYDANLSTTDDDGLTGGDLDTRRAKAPLTTDARNGNATILLSTTGSSSGDDRNHTSLNAHSLSCSDRSATLSEISQWPSPEPAMSVSSNFVISSPNSSVDLSIEAKQSATLSAFPKYLNDYCNASSSRDPKDVPNTIPYTVPCTSRSTSSQIAAHNDLTNHYLENLRAGTGSGVGASSNFPTTRSGVESTGERVSRNHDDTWTILKPSASAVLSDESTSDSLDLDENRPRLKSIVITRANNQSTSRQRSSTPDRASSHTSRDSHAYKNYSKKSMNKKVEKSMRKKGRRVSSESSGDERTYVKWNRKRHLDSVQSSSS